MLRGGYIYIMTNPSRTVLYIGVTSDLKRRIWEHRNHFHPDSFTAKYNVINLVYYEGFSSIEEAINRETQLKKWTRDKKDSIINSRNPDRRDLYDEIMSDIFSLL